jgi:uncharacterized YkwD family protein
MKHKRRKIAWISMLCAVLVLLPASIVWGFGTGSKGSDINSVQGMLPLPAPNTAPKPPLIPYSSPYSTPYISPIPAPIPSPYPLTGLTADERQMIKLVNEDRTAAGLHALIADSALTQTARLKSQDMVKLNYFAHQSPSYGSPFDMMSQFGIDFQTAGENIACNQSVPAAHQALMNSQGHRENILNGSFVYIGIGIISGGPCGQMYTEQFVGR